MLGLLLWLQLAHPTMVLKPFPNHNTIRATSDNIVVVHYDSGESVPGTLRYLKRKRNAYHYVIGRDGTIFKLIDPKYEARHAGLSYFRGHLRLNHYSIGICLSGTGVMPFTEAEYASLSWLLRELKARYADIDTTKIVGHSDIAIPRGRKRDPGPNFDWQKLFVMFEQEISNEHIRSKDTSNRRTRHPSNRGSS
jgi:N-acetylmuramoyl-L-alanine amidase